LSDGCMLTCGAPIRRIIGAPVAGGRHPRHRAVAGHHAADANRVRADWHACLLDAFNAPHGAGEGAAATGVRRLPRMRLLRPALLGVLQAASGRVRAVLNQRER
jgi:hypothetical protein